MNIHEQYIQYMDIYGVNPRYRIYIYTYLYPIERVIWMWTTGVQRFDHHMFFNPDVEGRMPNLVDHQTNHQNIL